MSSFSREMDNVSRLFMSSGDDGNDTESSQSRIKELPLNNREDDIEIEERISSQKKFAYPDDANVQNKIMMRLQTLIQEGYNISRVELNKKTTFKKPGRKKTLDDQIILYVKDSEEE